MKNEKYELLKNTTILILEDLKNMTNNKLEIDVDNKNNDEVYGVNFYNNNKSGTLIILDDKDDEWYRPFKYVFFEVFEIISDEENLIYYYYDDENSTLEDIIKGVQGGIDYLIDHKS